MTLIGDKVNIEIDMLAKYIEKLLKERSGIDKDFLKKHGFIK